MAIENEEVIVLDAEPIEYFQFDDPYLNYLRRRIKELEEEQKYTHLMQIQRNCMLDKLEKYEQKRSFIDRIRDHCGFMGKRKRTSE